MGDFIGKIFESPQECGKFFGLPIHQKSIYMGRVNRTRSSKTDGLWELMMNSLMSYT